MLSAFSVVWFPSFVEGVEHTDDWSVVRVSVPELLLAHGCALSLSFCRFLSAEGGYLHSVQEALHLSHPVGWPVHRSFEAASMLIVIIRMIKERGEIVPFASDKAHRRHEAFLFCCDS